MISKDVFEHVGDAICCLDRAWRVIDLNPAAEIFLGVELKSVVGCVIWDRPLVSENQELTTALCAVMRSRQPLHVDLFLHNRDCWTDARIFPLAKGGLGVSWRDISDHKKREADLIEAVENQQMLFRELTHGVTNTLQEMTSRIQLQSRALTDPAAQRICKEIGAAIRSRSVIYNSLYRGNRTYAQDLGEYVRSLCADFAASLPQETQLTAVTTLRTNVPVEMATTVGVIIAELIVNASKHAWPAGCPGRMQVAMRRIGSMIELEFSDDGQGLPADVDLLESEGLGLKLIRLQVRRLKGRFTHRMTEHGASFLLSFPLPEPAVRPPEMATS